MYFKTLKVTYGVDNLTTTLEQLCLNSFFIHLFLFSFNRSLNLTNKQDRGDHILP